MSTSYPESLPLAVLPQGSAPPRATLSTRDRLALRCAWDERHRPEALDVEAACLDAGSTELRGVMSLLAPGGTDASEVHYREAWRGERRLHLIDLCALRASHRPEARRALSAVLAMLAAPPDAPRSVASVGADVARHSGCLTAALITALEDGRIDPHEREAIRSALAKLQPAAADLAAAVA